MFSMFKYSQQIVPTDNLVLSALGRLGNLSGLRGVLGANTSEGLGGTDLGGG